MCRDPTRCSVTACRQRVATSARRARRWSRGSLNLPDFVKLDLPGKRMHTTAASAEQRETPLQSVQRSNGTILIQGSQGERAFSWLISETSGEETLSVAAHGRGVTVFTVCTAVDKL